MLTAPDTGIRLLMHGGRTVRSSLSTGAAAQHSK